MLKAPFHDLAKPVRAVDTMTASCILVSLVLVFEVFDEKSDRMRIAHD